MSTKPQKRHPKKTHASGQKTALVVLGSVLGGILLGLCVIALMVGIFLKTHKPSVDTDTPPFDVPVVTPGDDTGDTGDDTDDTGSTSGDKYVRDKEIVNFLVVGRDKSAWNTDVMMLVNFNMRESKVNVLQIPRDTYIDDGDVHGRVNTVVKTMRQKAYKNDSSLSANELVHAGMNGTVELLEKSLCVQIDGYAIVNLEGFRNIINAIGGVYMDVPFDMEYDDPYQDLNIHLKKGPQILDGEKAEMFVRFRSGLLQGDIGRVDVQKIFLTALFKQVKNNFKISTIPTLVDQLIKYVSTDIPIADIIIYAKELLGVDINNISMMTLPGLDARSSSTGAWYYIMRRADTLLIINEYFNVYDKDITDEMFDSAHSFNAEDYSPFSEIYYSEATDVTVENAGDIDSSGIDIPLS